MDLRTGANAPEGEATEPGPIRGLLATALDTLRTRLELAAVEVEMYLLRVVQTVVWAMAAIACVLLAVAFGLVTLIIALWDTHRFAGLLGGTACFLVLGGLCGLLCARSFRSRPSILEGTLQQLERDHHSVRGPA